MRGKRFQNWYLILKELSMNISAAVKPVASSLRNHTVADLFSVCRQTFIATTAAGLGMTINGFINTAIIDELGKYQ